MYLLALPGAIIATFALLRAAVVGPDSAFFVHMQRQRRRDRPRSAAATRAWLVFGAVLTGFAGGLAVAAAVPPGPSVGVDLRAVAYGGDPSAGVLPSAFGVAVKGAHCSHARRLTPSRSPGARSRFGAVPPPKAPSTR